MHIDLYTATPVAHDAPGRRECWQE